MSLDGDLAVTTALAGAGPAPSNGLSPLACHSCRRRIQCPRRDVGARGPVARQHRTDRRSSEAVRGGESSSAANNLINVSCLTMEKSHVVRGSKNRLGKLLTTFADVKGKARAALGEKTSPAVPPRHSPSALPARARSRHGYGRAGSEGSNPWMGSGAEPPSRRTALLRVPIKRAGEDIRSRST